MARDFDMEKILDKMRELRDKRELEILSAQLENTDLDTDYQKRNSQDKVLDVQYIGEVEISGETKSIFKLIEQKETKENELIEIEKYYTEDGEVIAGNNLSDKYKQILLSEKYKDEDKLLEQLQEIENDNILDLNEIEIERLEEIAKTVGISKEEIDKLSEMKTEEKQEERTEYSEEEVEKITGKTEIRANQKVTDKETLESLLNVQEKGYRKIAVVYSDKLAENNNTTRFSFVGIKEDGTAEKIDTLEQRYGKNPTKTIQEVNRDGSEVQEEQVNSIFQIKGREEEQVAVDIGPMGTIETEFVRTPKENNEEAISIPIETNTIKPTTREVRELMNKQRNPRVKEEIERAKVHEELGCEEIEARDIDDNPNNNKHEHNIVVDDYVAQILKENEQIESVFTQKEVKKRIEKFAKESENIEEAVKKAEADLQLDSQNFKTREK